MSQSKSIRKPLPIADSIFAAIAEQKALWKKFIRITDKCDTAEFEAAKTHGKRPLPLTVLRNYDAISLSEIDRAREELLRRPGADREQIETECKDAKARLAAAERAGIEWDRRAGIAQLREQCERTNLAEQRACMRMARTKPTTAAGAAALVNYALREIAAADIHLIYWHGPAIKTATAALVRMSSQ